MGHIFLQERMGLRFSQSIPAGSRDFMAEFLLTCLQSTFQKMLLRITSWKFLKEVFLKGLNLVRFARDGYSLWHYPIYHGQRLITTQISESAGLPVNLANALSDPIGESASIAEASLWNQAAMIFGQVIAKCKVIPIGESTAQGRMAVNSTATAMTGVGAGFTGGQCSSSSIYYYWELGWIRAAM